MTGRSVMWRSGVIRDPAVVVRYAPTPPAWTWALVVTTPSALQHPDAIPRVGLVRPFDWPAAPVPTVRDAVRELLRQERAC